MSKCSICKSKKGKRNCPVTKTYICSSCCGRTRKQSTCFECSYFQYSKKQRTYSSIPRYSTQEISENEELQEYAIAIEGSLCAFDNSKKNKMMDSMAIRIIELLLDTYYYKDMKVTCDDELIKNGYETILNTIKVDLAEIETGIISKILNTIYFVAKRRSTGHREYLDFIHKYVGVRLDTGVRLMEEI